MEDTQVAGIDVTVVPNTVGHVGSGYVVYVAPAVVVIYLNPFSDVGLIPFPIKYDVGVDHDASDLGINLTPKDLGAVILSKIIVDPLPS